MLNPIIYILINGSLKMSPGKAAAQAVHAFASLENDYTIKEFSRNIQRTVIVLEVDNQQQIDNLSKYLTACSIPCSSYIDEGVNEVSPYSVTAMAVGPIYSDELDKRQLFSTFPLFPKRKLEKKQSFFKKHL